MAKAKTIKKKTTIDDLAIMIGKGFGHVDEKFNQIDERFNQVDGKFSQIDERLASLESGQEDIKMKLNNVVYRFELVELQKRVGILERKVRV